jgi:hypothetical protein
MEEILREALSAARGKSRLTVAAVTTRGISGEMIRHLMLACVERRLPPSGRPILCSGWPTTDRPTPPMTHATSPQR